MRVFIFFLLSFFSLSANGQDTTKLELKEGLVKMESLDTTPYVNDTILYQEPEITKVKLKGKVYSAIVSNGDTLIVADLEDISITSMRKFDSDKDYRKYLKIRRYANKVFPYAQEAIRIFRELEYASEYLSKKEKKKEIKRLNKELKEEFEQPLIKLTKLQGKILIKMIERELDAEMYDLIKGLKGRFTAFYWHNFSKLYSYDLKEGYTFGQYPILDAVLQDFDLSYEIRNPGQLKYVNKIEKK